MTDIRTKTIAQLPLATSVSVTDKTLIWQDNVLKQAGVNILAEVSFASIASLRANTASYGVGREAYVKSYYANGNTGGGFFYRINDSSSSDDWGIIIVDNLGQRWKRAIINNEVSVVDFGAVPYDPAVTTDSAATDSGANLQKALDATRREKITLSFPYGRIKATTDVVNTSGYGWEPGSNTVYGQGKHLSEIYFENSIFNSFYGFAIKYDNTVLRDFSIRLKGKSGATGNNTAIVYLPSSNKTEVKNPTVRNVHIENAEGANYQYYVGISPVIVDVTNETLDNVSFKKGAYLWVKDTSDTSTQKFLLHKDIYIEDCIEGVEYNTPGLLLCNTTLGSAVATSLSSSFGTALSSIPVTVGMVVTSPVFPAGTTVVSFDNNAGTITFSANATATKINKEGRLSFGGISDLRVENIRGKNIQQWLVGVAHVKDFYIEAYCEDCWHEVVHVEDVCKNGKIIAGGYNCNTVQGVVVPGSPSTENINACGLVHISTGCHDIDVEFRNADLTGDDTRNRTALAVQIGGISGTTGTEDPPYNIKARGFIITRGEKTRAGGVNPDISDAFVALNCSIIFDNPTVFSNNTADKGKVFFKADTSFWSGSATVKNPKTIVDIVTNKTVNGSFDNLTIVSTQENFPDLKWATGFFPVTRNSFPLAKNVQLQGKARVSLTAPWTNLIPSPRFFLGNVHRGYHGTGGNHAYEIGPFNIREGVLENSILYQDDANIGGNIVLATSRPSATVTTGDTTNNSSLITNLASIANVVVGTPISGTGIPSGSVVTSIETSTSVRISKLCTATAAGVAVTFTIPGLAADGWRINSSYLQYRAYSATEELVDVIVNFNGLFVPDNPI